MVLVGGTRTGVGWKLGNKIPLEQEAALRLAQLFLTSRSPSPRKDLGTGLVIPSDKIQVN